MHHTIICRYSWRYIVRYSVVASSSDSRFAASYLRQRLSADISLALGAYSYLEGPTFLFIPPYRNLPCVILIRVSDGGL